MTDQDKREPRQPIITDDASRQLLAALGRATGGLSPQAFGGAWLNVASRLALSPGRQAQLALSMLQKSIALAQFAGTAVKGGEQAAPQAEGTPYAQRFADPAWSKFPFNVLAQSFITAAEIARASREGRAGSRPRRRQHRRFHAA